MVALILESFHFMWYVVVLKGRVIIMTIPKRNQYKHFGKNYPDEFWRFYDLYRRGKITLEEFGSKSQLSQEEILVYLDQLRNESFQVDHFVL